MYKSTLQLIAFCFLTMQLSAQFPTDFEFLEHRHAWSYPGAQKVHNEAIYYASHNLSKPATIVNKVTADKEFEVILKLRSYTESKLFVNSDTSFQIVLYRMVDYDVTAPGIYVVNVDGSEITIDSITMQTIPNIDYSFYVSNIEKDENENWISIIEDSIYRFDQTGILSSEVNPGDSNPEFFSNALGTLFTLTNFYNPNRSTISSFQNGDFLPLINFDSSVKNLTNTETGNYLATDKELLRYSVDFSTLLDSWNLSSFEGEIQKVHFHNGRLLLLTQSDHNYSVYQLNSSSVSPLIHKEILNEGELIYDFHALDSLQYLLTGTFNELELTNNVFFRNINIDDNSESNYPKVDISVSELEVIQSSKDTLDTNIDIMGDTVYSFKYTYDLFTSITNNSADSYHITNAYTQDLIPFFGIYSPLSLEIDSLLPFETISLDSSVFSYNSGIVEFSLVIPGANYMFNISDQKIKTVTPISSTINPLVESLEIYPNPTQDFIHLNTTEILSKVTIYDALGYLVYYRQKDDIGKQIDISFLPPGTYQLSVQAQNSDHLLIAKIIKM